MISSRMFDIYTIILSNLIINLRGGTGNQLFQAAAAASLAYLYKKNCQFCIDKLSKDKYKRKLEINPILKNLGVKEKQIKSNSRIIYLDQYDIDHPIYFSKKSPLASFSNDIQLEGNFTNYRILNPNVIKKIKDSINQLETTKKFKELKFIAIHLRELHGISDGEMFKQIDNIKISFYKEAIEKIIKNSSISEINNAVIFCDTWRNPERSKLLPQIKEILNKFGINYINGDREIQSTLDIVNIFSLSKYCIISNSTLSWWGAYLSKGKVFSPVMNLWEPDLKIPDHWQQIYADEIKPFTHHDKFIFKNSIKSDLPINYAIYNSRRLLITKIFRKILKKIYRTSFINFINKWLNYIGLVQENPNKTFL